MKIKTKPLPSGGMNLYWGNDQYIGYAYKEVDGYYVFVFGKGEGSWSDYALREIADKLTELNKDWDEIIKKVLK